MISTFRLAAEGGRGAEESKAVTAAVMRAVKEGAIDPTRTRTVADWVQYRQNFREPVALRPISVPDASASTEIAFDLRRAKPEELDATLARALEGADRDGAVYLEEWTRASKSAIWQFNLMYWSDLALWEEVTGKDYAQALPGGESAATNTGAARSVIEELFRIWDALVERHALPDQLTVLELGVGNGDQAKVWLDEFVKLDKELGRDYYRRLHYLMGDYSSLVLDLARANTTEHHSRVSTLVLDAARPLETLRFLESKVFFVFISNVYDNLPTDELAVIDDHLYQVEMRAYIPRDQAERIATGLNAKPEQILDLTRRLLRLGPRLLAESAPDHFANALAATAFWQEVWAAVRTAERYTPLGPLDDYEICEGITGEVLEPLTDGHGDVRFHVSNGAVASFIDTLPLLHPLGLFVCHDLFVTDLEQFQTGFRGPGKYDGSVVNWVNGPIMKTSASRRGFAVEFSPFAHGSKSPISTATARARD
jgi:hypothetical protein